MTIDQDFVELYKDMGKSMFGGDTLLMTVFAKLYIQPGEMAIEDLAKQTGYSLASISNTVKMMVSMGMAKKVRKPGSRKLYVFVEKDFLKMMKEQMMMKQKYGVDIVIKEVPGIIDKHEKEKKMTEKTQQKLKILKNYYDQMKKMDSVMKDMIHKIDEIDKK